MDDMDSVISGDIADEEVIFALDEVDIPDILNVKSTGLDLDFVGWELGALFMAAWFTGGCGF